MPINDHEDTESVGGSHWKHGRSLLVFLKEQKVFLHYDSLRGSNFLRAKRTAIKFGKLLGFEAKGYSFENIVLSLIIE